MAEVVDHLIAAGCWGCGAVLGVLIVLCVALFIVGWREDGTH